MGRLFPNTAASLVVSKYKMTTLRTTLCVAKGRSSAAQRSFRHKHNCPMSSKSKSASSIPLSTNNNDDDEVAAVIRDAYQRADRCSNDDASVIDRQSRDIEKCLAEVYRAHATSRSTSREAPPPPPPSSSKEDHLLRQRQPSSYYPPGSSDGAVHNIHRSEHYYHDDDGRRGIVERRATK